MCHFGIVETIIPSGAFSFLRHSCSRKVLVEWKDHIQWVGLLFSSHSFNKFTLFDYESFWVDPAPSQYLIIILWRLLHFITQNNFFLLLSSLTLFDTRQFHQLSNFEKALTQSCDLGIKWSGDATRGSQYIFGAIIRKAQYCSL